MGTSEGQTRRETDDESSVSTGWSHPLLSSEVAFWAAFGMLVISIYLVGEDSGNWFGLVVILVLIGMSYHFLGRRADRTGDARLSAAYVVLLAVLCGTAVAFVASAAFLLFIALPQAWHIAGNFWWSLLGTIVVLVTVTLGGLLYRGFEWGHLLSMLPWLGLSLVLAIALGVSVDRVVAQSEERGHLIAELRRTQAELAEANHAAGVATERARVAREIHDTLAQGFTSIAMLAGNARADVGGGRAVDPQALELIEETARDNLAEARALVAAFTPVALDGTTLADALSQLGERFGRETGLRVDVRAPIADGGERIPVTQQVVIVRSVQESLANIRKHADARNIVITLDDRDGHPTLDIHDDGRGFEPAELPPGGYGLHSMRSRAEEAGGSLQVDSAPGEGARVRVRLPGAGEDG